VQELLARWRVPASCLELEVTGSAIMADPDRARRILVRLAGSGVMLSLDDFGAGYTSLAQLEDLRVHQLEIDRSLVAPKAADASNALIVRSVVGFGHSLGLTLVAEGVEDEATPRQAGRDGLRRWPGAATSAARWRPSSWTSGSTRRSPSGPDRASRGPGVPGVRGMLGQGVVSAPAAGEVSPPEESCEESCEEDSCEEPSDDPSEESDGSLSVVGSASEVRVGVADDDSSLSDPSSSSDVDSSSVPVVGALVPVAGAVVVGDDGVDGSSSCSAEDDEALVIAPIVVVVDVSAPPTSADTGRCPMSSIPVTMPIAMTNTAAA